MAETTGIAWCDSTFNAWIGCTEVSDGCTNCYARELDKRHRYGGAVHWGAGVPRYRTNAANWRKPLAWNKKAMASGKRWLVFTNSLADVFDNEVPEEWHTDLANLIGETPNLIWLLLTKRISNTKRWLPVDGIHDPVQPLPNVWLGASVVNQEEADRDIPKLLATPAAKRFVSYEPALGPVDFSAWLEGHEDNGVAWQAGRYVGTCLRWTPPLDWLIVGGESAQGGAKARPFDLAWARSTIKQCKAPGVAVFCKQIGANAGTLLRANDGTWERFPTKDRAGADPAEWPADLRVREFPA